MTKTLPQKTKKKRKEKKTYNNFFNHPFVIDDDEMELSNILIPLCRYDF